MLDSLYLSSIFFFSKIISTCFIYLKSHLQCLVFLSTICIYFCVPSSSVFIWNHFFLLFVILSPIVTFWRFLNSNFSFTFYIIFLVSSQFWPDIFWHWHYAIFICGLISYSCIWGSEALLSSFVNIAPSMHFWFHYTVCFDVVIHGDSNSCTAFFPESVYILKTHEYFLFLCPWDISP